MDISFSLDHVAVSVSDFDASLSFYTGILGFTCERVMDIPDGNGKIALLRKPDLTIEMFGFTDTSPRPSAEEPLIADLKTIGVKHIALRVKDIWEAADFLRERGVEFISEPVKGARGYYRFFIADPDGIPIELSEGPE